MSDTNKFRLHFVCIKNRELYAVCAHDTLHDAHLTLVVAPRARRTINTNLELFLCNRFHASTLIWCSALLCMPHSFTAKRDCKSACVSIILKIWIVAIEINMDQNNWKQRKLNLYLKIRAMAACEIPIFPFHSKIRINYSLFNSIWTGGSRRNGIGVGRTKNCLNAS